MSGDAVDVGELILLMTGLGDGLLKPRLRRRRQRRSVPEADTVVGAKWGSCAGRRLGEGGGNKRPGEAELISLPCGTPFVLELLVDDAAEVRPSVLERNIVDSDMAFRIGDFVPLGDTTLALMSDGIVVHDDDDASPFIWTGNDWLLMVGLESPRLPLLVLVAELPNCLLSR